MTGQATKEKITPSFIKANHATELLKHVKEDHLIQFLHDTMKPYEDTKEDIHRALNQALSESSRGFVMLMMAKNKLGGALVMLETGMKGFIPEFLLLFVSVDPDLRGLGLGKQLINQSLKECKGDVKLHVEYENPAKRLYERIGFTSKYAEMRYSQ